MSVLKYIPKIIPHSDETAEFITWIKIIGNVLVVRGAALCFLNVNAQQGRAYVNER